MNTGLTAGAGIGTRRSDGLTPLQGLRYGALGAPLAFAALPLYVLLPSLYSGSLGVPLASLGAVLLATRALDALVDPWLGRLADRVLARPRRDAMALAGLAGLLLAAGFAALFYPPAGSPDSLLAWCAAALVVTCLGYSSLGVLHQAWGARLGGGPALQARVVAWREGLALAGVLAASVLPALAGMGLAVAAFVWAARLGTGDSAAFALICGVSGAAFGADLAVPGALLAGLIRRAGHALHHEGQYFGWWTCANKLNLALAAGLSLPLLQALGYSPGARDSAALGHLALIYAAVPCLLKGAAAALLWHHRHSLDRP